MRMFAAVVMLVVAGLLAGGCSSEAAKPVLTRAERRADAELRLASMPPPRRYALPDGDMLVLEVSVRDGEWLVETQRCFVWRDRALGTATMSCPQPAASE